MARYFPQVFDVADVQRAKAIILTDEGPGADTETRWAVETPYVLELIQGALALRADMVVLDYGCGIGRMAKAMIDASGCSVIGVDISPSMRKLAEDYVRSDRFVVISPQQFDVMVGAGLRVHAAIAIWVLQHCSLADGGHCFVLNMRKRAVPALRDKAGADAGFVWAADAVDVAALLRTAFRVEAQGEPDNTRVPNMAAVGADWFSLRQREG
jgi:SAM-dependent methyltransferase